ncbi:MAG: S1C family serine protease [Clostridia bacterium]|nr:S1C family serine protease [Clostridia bacterium]
MAGCGNKQISATEIYNQCLYNVVEVKAVSENVGESFGTAEIISKDGKLITYAHVVTYTRLNVVNTFDSYYIRFSYEDEYREVTLEKFDSEKDIALLKLKDTACLDIKPINFGNSDDLKSGQRIYAVGNASNYGIGIFEGIVSIPLINIELDKIKRSVIQCDLTIAAGNSGGALLNASGELVGITTFRTKDNSGNVIYGIVYCIPVNTVIEFVNAQ